MIQIDHLCKVVDGQDVLRDVTLEINGSEVFAIIGRSGSGKTVLLKHMVGLLRPDAGRVVVNDVDIGAASDEELQQVRRHFGVLFQNGALFDYMTIFENTAFPMRMLTNKSEDEIEHRVMECLEMVDLPNAAGKMPAQISGGEKKRAALARAIVLEPQYLFYDEPDSGLDPETSTTIDALIAHLSQKLRVTSVVVTHNMHTVLSIADRVGFLYDGVMRFVGSVEEMRASTDKELCDFMRANEYHV